MSQMQPSGGSLQSLVFIVAGLPVLCAGLVLYFLVVGVERLLRAP